MFLLFVMIFVCQPHVCFDNLLWFYNAIHVELFCRKNREAFQSRSNHEHRKNDNSSCATHTIEQGRKRMCAELLVRCRAPRRGFSGSISNLNQPTNTQFGQDWFGAKSWTGRKIHNWPDMYMCSYISHPDRSLEANPEKEHTLLLGAALKH